ncbi:MAG: glutamate--tRNA ligase [Steroidobacteraceae bacterium]|jgi:glutamyl-tRNA synthetase|nr:glutamate--tRNA ligase [Steroidobacteraceae bacterium]
MSRALTTRFAPSPTGRLHLGNARTALFAFLLARAAGGRFVLRVEDTDSERSSEAFLEAQLADLRWLGLDWDAGPGREDAAGPYRQSQRGAIYAEHYDRLEREGHAYPCYCSQETLAVARRTQLARGEPPRYPGTCRELGALGRAAHEAAGRRPVLRFRVPPGQSLEFDDLVRGPQRFATDDIGDFVLRRADGVPVFFFCNALDDALMGVTHVLRGEDHLANTPRQRLLLEALGLEAPAYGHLPLLVGADGAPLSKRRGAASLGELRERGYLPGAIANYLLRLGHAGAPDGWVEPAALAGHFALDRVGRAPAHFDESQLLHWQREAVKHLDEAACADWLGPALPPDPGAGARATLVRLLRHNVLFPLEAAPWAAVLFGDLPAPSGDAEAQLHEAGPGFFAAARAALELAGPDLPALAREIRARTGRRGADLYRPLRAALTGRCDGPELGPLLAALPLDTIRSRLEAAEVATGRA